MSEAKSDEATVREIRAKIRSYLHGDNPENTGMPLRKGEVADILVHLSDGDEFTKSDWLDEGVEKLRYRVATQFDNDVSQFGHGSPFPKSRLKQIWNEIAPSDDTKQTRLDPQWVVGSVDKSEYSADERQLEQVTPEKAERRFEVLETLANVGPSTVSEMKKITNIPNTSISSEMTRLYQNKMADRSDRARRGDVYLYWVTPEGFNQLYEHSRHDTFEDRQMHIELNKLYGSEQE